MLAAVLGLLTWKYYDHQSKLHYCTAESINSKISTWGAYPVDKGDAIDAINAAIFVCNSASRGPCLAVQCEIIDHEEFELRKKISAPPLAPKTPAKKPDLMI